MPGSYGNAHWDLGGLGFTRGKMGLCGYRLELKSAHRFLRGAGDGDSKLIVGNDSEVVGGEGHQILVADCIVLHPAARRLELGLPLVVVCIKEVRMMNIDISKQKHIG